MEKIKKIVTSGRKHGEEYLDHSSASNQGTGSSASDNAARAGTQTGSGGSGTATAGNTSTGGNTSTTGYTTSGYDNSGKVSAVNPQEYTTTTNTSGYSNTGTSAPGQTATGYPTSAGQTTTGYPATSGYSSTGNNAPVNTGSGYPRDSARTRQDTSGHNTTGNTAVGSNAPGYQTTGNTTTQSRAAGSPTGLGTDERHLSKSPNESTSITSGLGSQTTPGPGNAYVEGGLTRGFQSTGAAENVTGTSGAQTSLTGQDNTGTSASYQDTSTPTTSRDRNLARDTAAVGTGGAAAAGTHLHRQTVKDTETGANTTATGQRLGHDTVAAGATGQGSHLRRQAARENIGSDAGYTAPSVDPSSGQHLGRDAAVLGGVGTAGIAGHEYRKQEAGKGARAGTTTTGADSGAKASATTSTGQPSGAYDTTTSSGHGTGLGATGLADGRDKPAKVTTSGTTGDSSGEGPAPHTAGPHKYDWMNKLDPRVDANPDASQSSATEAKSGSTEGDQHYGRDAAIGAGIGGIGGAAYGSAKQGHTRADSGVAGVGNGAAKDQYNSKTAGTSEQKYPSRYTTDHNTKGTTTTITSSGTTGYQGSGTEPGYQTASTADPTSGHLYGRDAGIAGGGVAALGGAAALGEQQYQKHERSIPLVGKGATSDVNDKLQGRTGPTGTTGVSDFGTATGASGTTRTTGTTGTTGVGGTTKSTETADPYRYDTYPSGISSVPDRTKEQHHDGRDAAIGAGGVGGAGLAAHELRKHEDTGYSGTRTGPTSGQERATGVSGSDASGASTSTAKQSTTQQQYGRDSTIAGGVGSSQGTSKLHYRTLSSGTPSGVASTPLESNAPSQFGSNTSGQVGSSTSGQSGQSSSGQFGSNAPAPSGQYASKTSGLQSTMPGTFPADTYGSSTYSAAQGTAGVGTGAGVGSQYTTSKHGPTKVPSDESGHTKLHKEPHSEGLASTVKHKLGI